MQLDSYESTVAMHGMTAAEYAEQRGIQIWEIPLAERLKLAFQAPPAERIAPPPVKIQIDLEEDEEEKGEENFKLDRFADIAETLEVFGIDSFLSNDSLTLMNRDGAEVEISRSRAENEPFRAILASLSPLGLWNHRREIRTDWIMLYA